MADGSGGVPVTTAADYQRRVRSNRDAAQNEAERRRKKGTAMAFHARHLGDGGDPVAQKIHKELYELCGSIEMSKDIERQYEALARHHENKAKETVRSGRHFERLAQKTGFEVVTGGWWTVERSAGSDYDNGTSTDSMVTDRDGWMVAQSSRSTSTRTFPLRSGVAFT